MDFVLAEAIPALCVDYYYYAYCIRINESDWLNVHVLYWQVGEGVMENDASDWSKVNPLGSVEQLPTTLVRE